MEIENISRGRDSNRALPESSSQESKRPKIIGNGGDGYVHDPLAPMDLVNRDSVNQRSLKIPRSDLEDLSNVLLDRLNVQKEKLQFIDQKINDLKTGVIQARPGMTVDALGLTASILRKLIAEDEASFVEVTGQLAALQDSDNNRSRSGKAEQDQRSERQWFTETFLISEKDNKVVIPTDPEDQTVSEFSAQFFRFIQTYFPDKNFEIVYQRIEKNSLPKAELEFGIDIVRSLNFIFAKDFLSMPMAYNSRMKEFVEAMLCKFVTFLGITDAMPRLRSEKESKSFYFKILLDKHYKVLSNPFVRTIVDRLFSLANRIIENINDKRCHLLCDFVAKKKDFLLPKIGKEGMNRLEVLSLKTYKRYVLSSEWREILKNFSVVDDVKIEKKMQKAYANRELFVYWERLEHNLSYRKNHFEECKALLDIRASFFSTGAKKEKKSKGRQVEPAPPLETILSQNSSVIDKINEISVLGLYLSSVGWNFRSNPMMPLLVLDTQGSISIGEDEISIIYESLLKRANSLSKESPKLPDNVREFSNLLRLNALPSIRRLSTILVHRNPR